MGLFPEGEGSYVKARPPLSTQTYGFKQHVFVDSAVVNHSANDEQANTRIASIDRGCSLICPISVLGTSSANDDYQYGLDMGVQLSLPLNVHYIGHFLFLAPNGRWSELEYILNKDHLVSEFLADFRSWSKLNMFTNNI
jgi:hypothetical protein